MKIKFAVSLIDHKVFKEVQVSKMKINLQEKITSDITNTLKIYYL